MENDAGFIQAILSNPGDADLLMVYADWLDERGDPRGEFLRLRAERSRALGTGHKAAAVLESSLEELRSLVDPVWAAVIETLAVEPEPVRLWFEFFDCSR